MRTANYSLFHYGTLVELDGFDIASLPHDLREYITRDGDGPFRWLHNGELVDGPSLIALHESEDEGPRLGRADGAYAIANLIGGDVLLGYHDYCYGPFASPEECAANIQAGYDYADELAAREAGLPLPPIQERPGDRDIIERTFLCDNIYFHAIDRDHTYAIAIVHCTGYTTWCLACVDGGRTRLWHFCDNEQDVLSVMDDETMLPHEPMFTEAEYAELIRSDK